MVLPAKEFHPKATGDSRKLSLRSHDLQASESLVVLSKGSTTYLAHQKPVLTPYLRLGIIWSFTRFISSLR